MGIVTGLKLKAVENMRHEFDQRQAIACGSDSGGAHSKSRDRRRLMSHCLIGITAVAFMTIRQAGLAAFEEAPGKMLIDKKHARKSPDQVLRERAVDDSQGLLSFSKQSIRNGPSRMTRTTTVRSIAESRAGSGVGRCRRSYAQLARDRSAARRRTDSG